jgi:hypothetical protein
MKIETVNLLWVWVAVGPPDSNMLLGAGREPQGLCVLGAK